MTILGQNAIKPAPTPDHGAAKIKDIYNQMCVSISHQLAMVRKITNKHGRSAIDTAMGADATEFANFYAAAQTFAENHPGCTIEDLPS